MLEARLGPSTCACCSKRRARTIGLSLMSRAPRVGARFYNFSLKGERIADPADGSTGGLSAGRCQREGPLASLISGTWVLNMTDQVGRAEHTKALDLSRREALSQRYTGQSIGCAAFPYFFCNETFFTCHSILAFSMSATNCGLLDQYFSKYHPITLDASLSLG